MPLAALVLLSAALASPPRVWNDSIRDVYVDGLSLSDAATYRKVAERTGLDADAVVAAFEGPGARAAAGADFHRAASLGVTGFPTLLAVDGDRVTPLARGHATADEADQRLAALQTR